MNESYTIKSSDYFEAFSRTSKLSLIFFWLMRPDAETRLQSLPLPLNRNYKGYQGTKKVKCRVTSREGKPESNATFG